jgi:hypothetical protein
LISSLFVSLNRYRTLLADIAAGVSTITAAAMSATVRKRLKSKALPAILFFGLIDQRQPL